MKRKYWLLIVIVFVASFLRFYKLDSVPVSLFGDEMDVGYHAYSILKTGKDYYGNFLPFHFHSIAEWRTPLYLYSVVPTVALFGVSTLGVRIPAALFGVLGIVSFFYLIKVLRQEYFNNKSERIEYIAAFLLAINPWHIQYSRAAFEVTELLLFFTLALLFFFKGLKKPKYLYLSGLFFALMPWVYSTAKMFVPIFGVGMLLIFSKKIISVERKHLIGSAVLFAAVSLPIVYSILLGGGSQRFGYIGIFTDPTIEHEVGVARDVDAWGNSIPSRAFHNKFVVWGGSIADNYLKAYSSDFLFRTGDINLRHSIQDVGLFYKLDVIAIFFGIVYFFKNKIDSKIKLFTVFWLIAGVFPSALTRDGGNHATRLILILPPLILLISFGIEYLFTIKDKLLGRLALSGYIAVLLVLFIHYQHQYWIHNPVYAERWWHYGWEEAVETLKKYENDYDKIIVSTADEPPLIFFAGAYEYPPDKWHKEFVADNRVDLEGFGRVTKIGKYYFGSPQAGGVYEWGKVLDSKTLYLASQKEVEPNLIRQPESTPKDLNLVHSVAFPSGEPAFYIFTRRERNEK
jgi:4-amino-4-deoxy-L-arabinose transferase-like glycosyltransferase